MSYFKGKTVIVTGGAVIILGIALYGRAVPDET